MQSEKIIIEFVTKKEHQKRKEYKFETWFALSNSVMENPDYCDLNPLQFKALIYLYCQCSKAKWKPVAINYRHAEKLHDITRADLDHVLAILLNNQKIVVHEPIQAANGQPSGSDQAAREKEEREERERKKEGESTTSNEAAEAPSDDFSDSNFSPKDLAELWNHAVNAQGEELKKTLAQVSIEQFKPASKRWKHTAARLNDNPNPEYWKSVVERIFESNFCMGINDRGWVAGFDWLIKPETHIKVNEGNYANRKSKSGKAPPVGGHQRDHDHEAEIFGAIDEVLNAKSS